MASRHIDLSSAEGLRNTESELKTYRSSRSFVIDCYLSVDAADILRASELVCASLANCRKVIICGNTLTNFDSLLPLLRLILELTAENPRFALTFECTPATLRGALIALTVAQSTIEGAALRCDLCVSNTHNLTDSIEMANSYSALARGDTVGMRPLRVDNLWLSDLQESDLLMIESALEGISLNIGSCALVFAKGRIRTGARLPVQELQKLLADRRSSSSSRIYVERLFVLCQAGYLACEDVVVLVRLLQHLHSDAYTLLGREDYDIDQVLLVLALFEDRISDIQINSNIGWGAGKKESKMRSLDPLLETTGVIDFSFHRLSSRCALTSIRLNTGSETVLSYRTASILRERFAIDQAHLHLFSWRCEALVWECVRVANKIIVNLDDMISLSPGIAERLEKDFTAFARRLKEIKEPLYIDCRAYASALAWITDKLAGEDLSLVAYYGDNV